MKYNEFIERRHYDLARAKGLSSRDEAYGGASFQDKYDHHEFHDLVPKVGLPPQSRVLVVGCGTGSDACWLADQGFRVTAIDFVPVAIEMARSIAKTRGTVVDYQQEDICHPRGQYGKFDSIIDSYCLQSIVSDEDRSSVYSFVRDHLEPEASYMIVSAGYSPEKEYGETYRRDAQTGIVLQLLGEDERDLDEITTVEGREFIPARRHHTIDSLCSELKEHGFSIRYAEELPPDGALAVVAKREVGG